MSDWLDGKNRLNEHVLDLNGSFVSFRVHYWGAAEDFKANHFHKHAFFEMCYCTNGRGVYVDDGCTHEILAGTMFLTRPGIVHQITPASEGCSLLFVAFELLESSTKEAAILFQKLAVTSQYLKHAQDLTSSGLLWKSIITQASIGLTAVPTMLEGMGHALLSSFPEVFLENAVEQVKTQKRIVSSTMIHQAKLFIRDNLAQTLKLEDVAQHVHISSRHLNRLFLMEEGETVTAYIRKERIRFAQVWLKGNTKTLQAIAEETGFGNVHHFSRVFREQVGMPPAQYRNLNKRE